MSFFLQTSLLLKPPSCLLSVSQGPTGNILGPFWLVEPSHPHWHPSTSCLVWTTSVSRHLFLSTWGTFPAISPPAGTLLLERCPRCSKTGVWIRKLSKLDR